MSIKYFCILLSLSLLMVQCTTQQGNNDQKIADDIISHPKDPFQKLCQYWEVLDAENPVYTDVYEHQEEQVYNYPGIVFMTDSTFSENPRGKIRYGKFHYHGKMIDAKFDDGTPAKYFIQAVEGDSMVLQRIENNRKTLLYIKATNVFWPDASTDPYNEKNSLWRVKPSAPETQDQLKKRIKDCVKFYEYMFRGYAVSTNNDIDFLGLPCCFRWYQGGILVEGADHLDKKWIDCFYSEDQALQARQMIEDVLTNNKYTWDTTQTNWLLQTADVLKQIYNKM